MSDKEKKPKLTHAEKKAARKDRKAQHRLACTTVYFPDKTYLAQPVDIDKVTEMEVEGVKYKMPKMAYKYVGRWPFKARTLKRIFFKDLYYNVDFLAGVETPITIQSAHESAESTYILPSSFTQMLKESMYANMIRSMNKKNSTTNMTIIIIIIAVVGLVAFLGSKLMGMW